MIVSFRHKRLKRFFENDDCKGVRAEYIERIDDILSLLDAAATVEDMDVPTFRLHALVGDLKGFWSVVVRANWRIVFRLRPATRSTLT
jgi:toxin HigB-1